MSKSKLVIKEIACAHNPEGTRFVSNIFPNVTIEERAYADFYDGVLQATLLSHNPIVREGQEGGGIRFSIAATEENRQALRDGQQRGNLTFNELAQELPTVRDDHDLAATVLNASGLRSAEANLPAH